MAWASFFATGCTRGVGLPCQPACFLDSLNHPPNSQPSRNACVPVCHSATRPVYPLAWRHGVSGPQAVLMPRAPGQSSHFIAVTTAGQTSREARSPPLTRFEHTAWPRLNGWISRKARSRSFSKSLKDGMSPAKKLWPISSGSGGLLVQFSRRE